MASVGAKNGRLFIDFRFLGKRCKEYVGLTDTAAHRREASKIVKQVNAALTLGTFVYADFFPDSPRALLGVAKDEEVELIKRFDEFAEIWFSEKRVEWRQSYTDTIRVSLDKYLIPQFGKMRLTAITKASLLEFRAMLGRLPGIGGVSTMSASRINHIMTPLRMILTEASDRYEFNNPWRNIKPLKEPRTKVEPFTLDEVKLILRNVRPDYRAYFTVRFFTGLRSSEIDGLKWQYVDFDRRQLLVREALVQGKMVPTKTDGSQRDVDMNSLVVEALRQQAKVSRDRSEFVFCSGYGKPLINKNVTQRIWYPLLKSLNLSPRRPY